MKKLTLAQMNALLRAAQAYKAQPLFKREEDKLNDAALQRAMEKLNEGIEYEARRRFSDGVY